MRRPMKVTTPAAVGRRCGPPATAFALVLLAFFLVPAFASAAPEHKPLGAFCEPTGTATPPCKPEFAKAAGMTVDPATGDLYVIDPEAKTLSRFHEDGTAAKFSALSGNVIDGHAGEEDEVPVQKEILSSEGFFGGFSETEVAVAPPGAVGGTEGDIYVTDASNGVIDVFASSGKFLGQQAVSSFPCGVAVDPKGNVFVGVKEGQVGVHKYIPTAPATLTESEKSPFIGSGETCQVAAGNGFVYGATFLSETAKFDSEGEEEGQLKYSIEVATGAASIDPTSGHLFVAVANFGEPEVREFDVSGLKDESLASSITLSSLGFGVAVSGKTGNVFATVNEKPNVEVFGPLPKPAVTKVTPVEGQAGTVVEITGTNLGEATEVAFGGKIVKSPFIQNTATKIKVKSPAGCVGLVDVRVTVPGGTSLVVPADKFTCVPPSHTLTVSLAGTGSGGVTCNGTACAVSYPEGTSVTLVATPNSTSTFTGWAGAGCSGAGGCVVTINADTAVTATFTAKPKEECATNPALCPPPPPPTPVQCVVSKVKGLSLSQAKSALTKAHCKVGKVTKPKARKGKKLGPLVVKSSSPAAGAVRADGTKVSLTLAPKPKKKGGK